MQSIVVSKAILNVASYFHLELQKRLINQMYSNWSYQILVVPNLLSGYSHSRQQVTYRKFLLKIHMACFLESVWATYFLVPNTTLHLLSQYVIKRNKMKITRNLQCNSICLHCVLYSKLMSPIHLQLPPNYEVTVFSLHLSLLIMEFPYHLSLIK